MPKGKIGLRSVERVRGEALVAAIASAREEGGKEFKRLIGNPLFLTGVTLFWTGGTKTLTNQIRFSSTDPEKILLFRKFLTDLCGVEEEDIRLTLILHPDIDSSSAERFWSFASGSPLKRFYKTSTLKEGRVSRRAGQGMCTLILGGKYLREKMDVWIRLLPKELMKQG
jgi:hypothetical protein